MTALALVEPDRSQFQVITLTVRPTSQPTTRSTASGSIVTSLRVAIQRSRKYGADQGADFVDVTVFGHQAETCATYLSKGRRIAVDGQLHHSEWDSENGRRQKLEAIARNVEFLDRAGEDTDPADSPASEVATTA